MASGQADHHDTGPPGETTRYALLGCPNTGKTSLFNRLCGVRSRTANFPGTTAEVRVGRCQLADRRAQIADLPGTYLLDLDVPEARTCSAYLGCGDDDADSPDGVLVVIDAMHVARQLRLVSEVIGRGLPMVVAVNFMDAAKRRGIDIDMDALSAAVGCRVIGISARTGQGVEELREAMARPVVSTVSPPSATEAAVWGRTIAESVGATSADETLTDRLDGWLTHPVLGPMVFAAVMAGLFVTIFSFSSVPMDLIELVFAGLGSALSALLPDGAIHDLMVDGVVGGIAGTVVFLPQICMLFFLISLLEDSGYLARAAFIADRFMRRFGLPGQAFVPLLSAHACAIPAVMSARLIPSPRDRLRTIFVAPFMSCSARLPVYVLLISLLFPGRPVMAGLAFAGCYALGIAAAIFTSVLMRHSLVRGPAGAMMIELPAYKLPSVRTALLTTFDRGVVFLRDAGTVILAICVVLWWASAYPQASAPPAEAVSLRAEAARLVETEPGRAEQLEAEANSLEGRHDLELSAVGRIGHAVEPVFRPLGMDWQLGIGVLTSFAAREVFVSSMAVITAASDDTDDPEVLARIATAKRDDGTDLFTTSNAAALLVFYVLAMQCLPTLAVVRRETGSWKWPLLQLVYMTVLAYTAALLVRWLVLLTGAS